MCRYATARCEQEDSPAGGEKPGLILLPKKKTWGKALKPFKCKHCGESNPKEFYYGSKSLCKACQKKQCVKRQHERYQKLKKHEWLKCSRCRRKFDPKRVKVQERLEMMLCPKCYDMETVRRFKRLQIADRMGDT
jgi:DNA-directed RNA polymerase subunit M/transcription elongation factor TFIIS